MAYGLKASSCDPFYGTLKGTFCCNVSHIKSDAQGGT